MAPTAPKAPECSFKVAPVPMCVIALQWTHTLTTQPNKVEEGVRLPTPT